MSEQTGSSELKTGAVSTAEVTVMAVAGAAPVMCIGGSLGAMLGLTGPGVALAAGIAALMCAVVGLCYGHLSKDYNCAGGSYSYVTSVFGTKAGLWSAFVYYGVCVTTAAGPACIFANYFNSLSGLPTWLGWIIYAAVVFIVCWQGIALSTKATAVVFVVEMVLMLIPAIMVVSMNGGFNFGVSLGNAVTAGNGIAGLFAAVVVWIYSFVGFEAASFMGEELRDGWRGVNKSVPLTALLTGVVYVISFFIWTANITPEQIETLTAAADPLAAFCQMVGYTTGGSMVSLSVMVASLACGMALCPMFSRFMYDQGRTGLLPKALTKVNKFGTPYVAQIVYIAMSLVFSIYGLYCFSEDGLFDGLNDILAVCGIMALSTYALICFTAVKDLAKESGASALIFGKILPVLVALVALYSIFFTQSPKFVIIAIVWYVVSAILAVVFNKRVDKDVLTS